jgi:hypothetical protein
MAVVSHVETSEKVRSSMRTSVTVMQPYSLIML